jgi:hypothetical protein
MDKTQVERTKRYRANLKAKADRVPALEARIAELEAQLGKAKTIAVLAVEKTKKQTEEIHGLHSRIDEMERGDYGGEELIVEPMEPVMEWEVSAD